LVVLLWTSPASADTTTVCTTNVAGVQTCTSDAPSTSQLHEIEQEMLFGFALLIFLGAAHVVGSWRR